MQSSTHHFDGGAVTRFVTDRGSVVVLVRPDGEDASIEVYEAAACVSAVGSEDKDFAMSEASMAARNRFGPGLIRKMLRHVAAANPWVRRWTWDRTIRDVRAAGRA